MPGSLPHIPVLTTIEILPPFRDGRGLSSSIVPIARRNPQIVRCRDFEFMERIEGERDVPRIVSQQILCAQLSQNISESFIYAGAEAGSEYASACALAERGERVLSADIAARLVGDGHHQNGINHRVGKLGGLKR